MSDQESQETSLEEESSDQVENRKLRRLSVDPNYREWIVKTLAVHPPRRASELFLREHPDFNQYGSREHVLSQLLDRFKCYIHKTDREIYHEIKDRREEINKRTEEIKGRWENDLNDLIGFYPYLNPINRLLLLNAMLDEPDLTISDIRGLIADIDKFQSKIEGVESGELKDQGHFPHNEGDVGSDGATNQGIAAAAQEERDKEKKGA